MNDKESVDKNDRSANFLLENLDLKEDKPEPKRGKISYEPENMLSFEEVKTLDEKYVLDTYSRMPVSFAYGSGEFLFDTEGNEYIDFLSGIAVTALGHAHADLVETLLRQADLIWHSSNLFYNQQQALLARALIEISFPGKVFFANSGTEANEAAIKFIRAYGEKKSKGKIIALENGFHGRTFGAMSITGQKKIHDGFGPLLENVEFIKPNDFKSLESAFTGDVAGLIMEPILGEGGIIPLSREFLQKSRDLCYQNKALLVFDEIQTGMGRTGNYFAWQEHNIIPDVMTLAKGLGGGFPIGAMIVAEKYKDVFHSGMHGSTFGGNHLAAAIGYEVIRLIEHHKVLENVKVMSGKLMDRLYDLSKKYPDKITGIRGRGLLIGIVLKEGIAARPLVEKALKKHIVVGRAAENVIRLAPPLIVREKTIERACEKLETLIKEI